MHTVSKDISFSAGHCLANYNGPCHNFHGHNFLIKVAIQGPVLDNRGLLIDFTEIKEKVKKWVDRFWDHKFLISKNDCRAKKLMKFKGSGIVLFHTNPTAENLSKHLFFICKNELKLKWVQSITVYETDTSCATYSEDRSCF